MSSALRCACGTAKRRKKSAADAKAVADILGIPHDTLDFSDTFRRDVVEYFIDAYGRGKTPNPCVACNRCVKFGRLWDEARRRGADLLATGHYARTAYNAERGVYTLLRGSDRRKDQSYVLYQLTQDLLPHVLFPMADFEKSDTRAMAQEWGLPVFNKPESQDICFIPDNDYKGISAPGTGPVCLKPEILSMQTAELSAGTKAFRRIQLASAAA